MNGIHVRVVIKWIEEGVNVKIIKIQQNNRQEMISLTPGQTLHPMTIFFGKGDISIASSEGMNINSLIHSNQSNQHQNKININYQSTSFQITIEELIALYFHQFKRMIEKKWIIKEVEVQTRHEEMNEIITKAFCLLGITADYS